MEVETIRALRRFWKDRGVPNRGNVPLGSIVFLPRDTAWVRLEPEVQPGALLGQGAQLMTVLDPTPVVSARLTEITAARYFDAADPSFVLDAEGTTRPLTVTSVTEADGEVVARFKPEGLDAIGEAMPTTEPLTVPGQLVITPPTTGTIVPLSALGAVGEPATTAKLRLPDGSSVDVSIRATVGGEAAVEGVEDGTRVRAIYSDER